MSASASDAQNDGPLPEQDDRKTVIEYGQGGIPLYITVSWVIFIIGYVVVMAILSLPDLTAWMQR
jgi:hypothetical protein